MAQKARGAYIASVCQPETSFDLSRAAQTVEFLPDDIALLNKQLQWQITNKSRGLRYVKLDQDTLQLVVFTDSKSLYDFLVKLGTIQEKQLMVDVMSLCQSYERQEITKVKWIYGHHNPADSMTKAKPSSALKTLIDTNCINISTTEWVERAGMKQASTGI